MTAHEQRVHSSHACSLLVEPTAATRRAPRHSTLHGGERACFTYAPFAKRVCMLALYDEHAR
jgi:hypothetical protein